MGYVRSQRAGTNSCPRKRSLAEIWHPAIAEDSVPRRCATTAGVLAKMGWPMRCISRCASGARRSQMNRRTAKAINYSLRGAAMRSRVSLKMATCRSTHLEGKPHRADRAGPPELAVLRNTASWQTGRRGHEPGRSPGSMATTGPQPRASRLGHGEFWRDEFGRRRAGS